MTGHSVRSGGDPPPVSHSPQGDKASDSVSISVANYTKQGTRRQEEESDLGRENPSRHDRHRVSQVE
ncbi:hypothetical protein Mapa_001872 [Marchantia paleacea]|nr:hypothetical protein Mapa_001872 [Marchantia paleacea]